MFPFRKPELLTGFFLLLVIAAKAQQPYTPITTFSNYYIDRLDISGNTDQFITSIKPVLRTDIYTFKNKGNTKLVNLSYRYIKADNFGYPRFDSVPENISNTGKNANWKNFKQRIFAEPVALFSVNTKDLNLIINPAFSFYGGYDQSNSDKTYQYTRGAEIRGSIDNKVGFYSIITANQIAVPNFYGQMIDSTHVIPGEGYHVNKPNYTYTYYQPRGYITFSPTKHIAMQVGHDRNFIGNGYRSLILSDFSKEYFFLKFNTKVWRFNYQNLYGQISDYTKQSATGKGIKPKYFVNHYLGLNLFKNLQLGVFESVVYDRGDSSKRGAIDFNYMNPIIFYTAIENNLNSSDNVMIGMDWKWNFLRRFSFYGQIVLDELAKKELINRTGWWGNKYAVQLGGKYIGAFGISGLDLQGEYNVVRPYTYSHFKLSQTYVNYDEPMAHPFGANFKEMIGLLRYQPAYRWFVNAGYIHVMKGLDSSSKGRHFGGDILTTYNKRPKEYGLEIGQGVKTTYDILYFNVSYMAYHNLWFDFRFNIRKVSSGLSWLNSNVNWVQFGLRMNMDRRPYDF